MTNLTIATVSIFGKEYNNLIIHNITTTSGTNSTITTIPYTISNKNSNFGLQNLSGYKDSLILTNIANVEYNYLVSTLLTTLGLTSSNY